MQMWRKVAMPWFFSASFFTVEVEGEGMAARDFSMGDRGPGEFQVMTSHDRKKSKLVHLYVY